MDQGLTCIKMRISVLSVSICVWRRVRQRGRQ